MAFSKILRVRVRLPPGTLKGTKMDISDTRKKALIALGQREAEIGQDPGSGPNQGNNCLYFFPGRYSPQIEWCRGKGLVQAGHCVFQNVASTLTSDGSTMIKPAFCLTEKGVEAAIFGSVSGRSATQEERDRVFGKIKAEQKHGV